MSIAGDQQFTAGQIIDLDEEMAKYYCLHEKAEMVDEISVKAVRLEKPVIEKAVRQVPKNQKLKR